MHKIWFIPKKALPPHVYPSRKTSRAAGIDLYSTKTVQIDSQEHALLSCGWEIILPPQTYGRIADVSSFSLLTGMHVISGVIDEDYEGEIGVVLSNPTRNRVVVQQYTKIAQLIITPYCDYRPAIMTNVMRSQINLLSDRGTAGFGFKSTVKLFDEHTKADIVFSPSQDEAWSWCQAGEQQQATQTIHCTSGETARNAPAKPIAEISTATTL